MKTCPRCEKALETPLVCVECEALLPVEGRPSPFEVFGLPPAWELGDKELKSRFLRLSRLLHPDYFATAEESQRELAESASALLNSAYEVLHDPVRRADWLVESLGGPSESEERQMPQEFLMEVLEWNETLVAARATDPGSSEREALPELATELRGERNQRIAELGDLLRPTPEVDPTALRVARKQLNAVRYVDRALTELESLRLESAALGGSSAG